MGLQFRRIDKCDSSRAIFKVKPGYYWFEIDFTIIKSLLEDGGFIRNSHHGDKYVMKEVSDLGPPALIQIRAGVADVGLPGIELDMENREISFDWKRTFSRFLADKAEAKARFGIVSPVPKPMGRAITLMQQPQAPTYDKTSGRFLRIGPARHQGDLQNAIESAKARHCKGSLSDWRRFVGDFTKRATLSSEAHLRVRWAADSWLDFDEDGLPIAKLMNERQTKLELERWEGRHADIHEIGLLPDGDPALFRYPFSPGAQSLHPDDREKVDGYLEARYVTEFRRIEVKCFGNARVVVKWYHGGDFIGQGQTSTNGRYGGRLIVGDGNIELWFTGYPW